MPTGSSIRTGCLIAASSSESSDILYATGFSAADEFICADLPEGRRVAVVSSLELQRARKEVRPGVEVMDRADIMRSRKVPAGEKNFFVCLSRCFDIGCWLVPERFPLAYADKLRQAGIAVQAVSGDFFPERAVKRPDEIEHIREAMKVTQDAMYQVQDFLKDSTVGPDGVLIWHEKPLTCEYIRSEIEAEFKRRGYSAERTIIACGADASAPHCIGSGPVRAHETLVADIFPRCDATGYWGDMTRTFVKGKASPVAKKAFEAVLLASNKVLSVLRQGVTGKDMHLLAAAILEEAGFRTGLDGNGVPCGFFHGLGHGVGLDIHENPRLSPANPSPLKAGGVVSVEPGLYDPSWGGIRLEDLAVIREDTCENLCTMPKELEIP